jgi:RNase P/RNase MRP subunit p29
MKRALLILVFCLVALPALPAAKTYQVTGPVLELTSDMIVVQKGSDRWQIARDAATKVTGDLKVGSKVTIEYRMTATSVDVKKK